MLARLEAPGGLLRGQHRGDASCGDRDTVILEDRARGLDRDHPARADEEVDGLHVQEPVSKINVLSRNFFDASSVFV